MFDDIISFIRSLYGNDFIPLHEPRFIGNEKKYLIECIDSTFVSSVGKFVDQFEKMICDITGANYAVAVVNGTAALHMSLILSDVKQNDEVITQALTFVATANAISYMGASPIFLDSGINNLALCPDDLENFLHQFAEMRSDGFCYNKSSGKRIKACVPMHTFGHPARMDEIVAICGKYNISLIEDAAESIGSLYKGKSTGTIAPIGVISFNGNKTVTCGGGGVLLFQNQTLASRAKHLTTTAKVPHKWEFFHDEVGYNYRMPNLNAALMCAQLELLPKFLISKRETASLYRKFFLNHKVSFFDQPVDCESSFWLNAIQLNNVDQRNEFLNKTNSSGVMTRPVWRLMNELPAFMEAQTTELTNAKRYQDCIVNIPSSVRMIF